MSAIESSPIENGIAIIAMAGRFPKAPTLEQFWQNLAQGIEAVSFFSDEELLASGVSPSSLQRENYVRARNVLEDVEFFDAGFFGYTAREAMLLDPQQRVFLQTAWEVLERGGYDPEHYESAIGVFAGSSRESYLWNNINENQETRNSISDYQKMIDNNRDFLATRVSYKLSLKGPSVVVQTACSTSLVAVHMACQSLLNYECDMALAGGVSISFPQKAGNFYQEGGILSQDGHCRAFDIRAQGCVGGDGCGVVLLKRLSDALEDRDQICAIIRGSAINNDGSNKVGFTAPSVEGQAGVIAMALACAGVSADSISYVEAHGTGTPLGDPIELAALNRVFRAQSGREHCCAISSVKPNIGHLDAAAGVAGLIKAVLALQHKQIPPSVNFETANPKIDFDHSPLYVNSSLQEWEAEPRRAGVSSFGIGGTNAHVVLEEAPQLESVHAGFNGKWQLLPLSGLDAAALSRVKTNLLNYLPANPNINLGDLAYTLQLGRKQCATREAIVCSTLSDAIAVLQDAPQAAIMRVQRGTEAAAKSSTEEAAVLISHLQVMAPEDPAMQSLLLALARLWVNGIKMNWTKLQSAHRYKRIALPTYPFERKSYWIAPSVDATSNKSASLALPDRVRLKTLSSVTELPRSTVGLIESQLEILSEQLRAFQPAVNRS
ncbi:MAG TPA: beta-ketoacyl synthase N-terminal-like domain-containing protein [Candidatus Angelobacter sp.]|jgi:acyl transferase domain-containing protein